MKFKIEKYQDRKKQWRWRLLSHNGNIIAESGQGYSRKQNMERGLSSTVKALAGEFKTVWL